jgi:aryl-alcohol dehydrogenase-like predicted oxidoreductase
VGAVFLPYFPLASGLLTGKYRRGASAPEGSRLARPRFAKKLADADFERVDALRKFAESRGHTLLELAFAWLLARPVVASVIAGAMTAEQVAANARAAEWKLGSEDVAAIDAIAPGVARSTP